MACLSIARDEEIDKGRPQGSREGRVEGEGATAAAVGPGSVRGALGMGHVIGKAGDIYLYIYTPIYDLILPNII